MAKSIHILMNDRSLDVTNGKDQFNVELPSWFPSDLTPESVIKLIDTVGGEAIVGKAIAQIVIDLRSVARAAADKGEIDPQDAVKAYKVLPPRKPQTAKTVSEKATDLFNGMTPEQIKKALKDAGLA